MFEAASESFVKAIGSETLIPITSIDRADNCQPLHVVVKKKRYWIWQSPKYQPTAFSLQEILTESSKGEDDYQLVCVRVLLQTLTPIPQPFHKPSSSLTLFPAITPTQSIIMCEIAPCNIPSVTLSKTVFPI